MRFLRSFIRQALVTYKSLFGVMDIKVYLLTRLCSPLASMLFFCYLALHAYGEDNIATWVIGNAFATCVFSVFLGAGLVMKMERNIGILGAIIATPMNRIVIFTSRSMMHILDGIIIAMVSITAGVLVFDLDVSSINIWVFALAIIVSMFSAISLGMVVCSIGLVVRDINMIMNIGILGLIILSGANVAIDQLPFFLRVISKGLPVSRGIAAGRLLYSGGNLSKVYLLIGQEFLIGLFYMFIGFLMFIFFEHLARKHAALDIY